VNGKSQVPSVLGEMLSDGELDEAMGGNQGGGVR